MNQSRDPQALSGEARELAGRMTADPTFCLDVAYQLLSGRARIEELSGELEREQHRLDVCVRALAPVAVESGGPMLRALRKLVPGLVFFVVGMAAFAILLAMLHAVRPQITRSVHQVGIER